MNNRFKYAPGLPGYGNKGDDGSTGTQGISTYVSLLSGITDAVTIGSKIAQNKELQIADASLAGGRTYQEGDYFIDTNSRVYQVDFGETNNFAYTGLSISVGGIFTQTINTDTPPGYTRYSNFFDTEKYLVDNVYQDTGVANYTAYPTNIYATLPKNFGRIEYVDVTKNSYYPFNVWTIGDNTNDEYAIALTRESTNNVWHWGNLDNVGTVRDVSLFLDFGDTYTPGNITAAGDVTVQGTLNTSGTLGFDNLDLTGWLQVGTDASIQNNLYVANLIEADGKITANDGIDSQDQVNIFGAGLSATGTVSGGNLSSSGQVSGATLNISGNSLMEDVRMTGDVSVNGDLFPNQDILFQGTGSGTVTHRMYITNVGGPGDHLLIQGGQTTGFTAGNLYLSGGESGSGNGDLYLGHNGTSAVGDVYLDGAIVYVNSTLDMNNNQIIDTGNITLNSSADRTIEMSSTSAKRNLNIFPANNTSGGGGDINIAGGSGSSGSGDVRLAYNGSTSQGNLYLHASTTFVEGTLDLQSNNIVGGNNGTFSGYLRVGDGTESAPGFSFRNDTDTGIFRDTNDGASELCLKADNGTSTHAEWRVKSDLSGGSEFVSEGRPGIIQPSLITSAGTGYDMRLDAGGNTGTGNSGNLNLGTVYANTITIGNHDVSTWIGSTTIQNTNLIGRSAKNLIMTDFANATSNIGFALGVVNDDTTTNAKGMYVKAGSSSVDVDLINFYTQSVSSITGRIWWDSNSSPQKLKFTGEAASTPSDRRAKTNIKPFEKDAFEYLDKLEIVNFNYRKTDASLNYTEEFNPQKEVGYIAQDVSTIIPHIVDYEKTRDCWGIRYEKIVPYLHKAIMQQKDEIKELKETVKKQQEQIDELLKLTKNKKGL